MPGGVMDLGQQFHRAGVFGIEDQDLLQEAVGSRNIAGMVCADGVAEQKARLFAVEFALIFGPALAEDLLTAFLAGGLRHPALVSE